MSDSDVEYITPIVSVPVQAPSRTGRALPDCVADLKECRISDGFASPVDVLVVYGNTSRSTAYKRWKAYKEKNPGATIAVRSLAMPGKSKRISTECVEIDVLRALLEAERKPSPSSVALKKGEKRKKNKLVERKTSERKPSRATWQTMLAGVRERKKTLDLTYKRDSLRLALEEAECELSMHCEKSK